MPKIFQNKIGAGFVLSYLLVFSIVIGIGILATVRLDQISASVDDLTNNLAADMALSKEIVNQTLLTRFHANKYISTQSQADLDHFNAEFAELETLLVQADRQITDPERVEMLNRIKPAVSEYENTFNKVVELVRNRQRIQSQVLDVQELLIKNKLTSLRIHVISLNDPMAFLALGNAQNAFQLMRLNIVRYLEAGDERYVVLFETGHQQAQTAFASLETVLQDPVQHENSTDAKIAAAAYCEGFYDIHADYVELKDLFSTKLDVLEPEISNTASEMVVSIEREFETQNEFSQVLISQTRLVLLVTTVIAVLAGLGLGVTLNRRIVERERAGQALRESEERYRGLFEHVPVGIYRSTPAGQFLDVNPAMTQILGYPDRESLLADEAAGIHVNAEHRDRWRTLVERAEVVRTYELQLRRRDGTAIWVTDNARAIRGQDNQVLYYEGTLEDITERKRAEEELRAYHDHLEDLVKERTAELTKANEQLEQEITERVRAEEQLQRYAVELEQANEEVKQFAYIVSHDLRAPLVNLKGFASELRYALKVIDPVVHAALPHLDEKQRQDVTVAFQEDVPEALGFIDSSATRMDRFINALLKLSRLGRRELKLELVDMKALVQETLETLAHQIEERQGKAAVGPLPEIVADRTSLEQIVGNLLDNAVKYLAPDRPAELEITAERGLDETIFRVRDNGRGIAEDDMDKVFAPFRRIGRQDMPGEGMGLPYVQALVRRHGGRIWCESELGVGTTFSFTISNHLEKGENDA